MCHYAVMLSPWGQSGQKAKSLSSASKRLFPISDPSEPSLCLYRFLEMGPRHMTYKLYKGLQSTYKVLRDKDDTSQSSYSMVVASVHRGLAVLRCLYAFLSRSTRRNRAPFHDDMRDLIDFHIFVQSSWLLTFSSPLTSLTINILYSLCILWLHGAMIQMLYYCLSTVLNTLHGAEYKITCGVYVCLLARAQ